MITGGSLALAHLALCLVALVAAAVSAHRARHGVRVNRQGSRYRRIATPDMLKRLAARPGRSPR